jgi:hypothetical protein
VSAGKLADFLEKVINVENKHIGKQIKPREVDWTAEIKINSLLLEIENHKWLPDHRPPITIFYPVRKRVSVIGYWDLRFNLRLGSGW